MAFDHEWGPQPPEGEPAPAAPPHSSRGAAAPDSDEEMEMIECEACHEEKTEGESVVVYTHRVEGRAVAEDTEWICRDCLNEAEEGELDRKLDAREWDGYDAWEERAKNGVRR